jgi:PAS domain S-box-containing protein
MNAIPAVEETRRLAALRELGVLDTLPEPAFDTITRAAAQLCGVPIALISLIDAQRQWFKSNVGLPGVAETPRDVAFCDHAIRDAALFEVPDATLDERFAANPLVTGEPGIRFYAGAPIVLATGERIGTVCVIDRAPHRLDDRQRAMLQSLAAIVGAMLAQRRQLLDATGRLAENELRVLEDVTATRLLEKELDRTHAHLDAVVDNMPALVGYWDRDAVTRFANRDFQAAVGLPGDRLIGHRLGEILSSIDAEGYATLEPRIEAVLRGRRQEFEWAMLTTSGLRQLRVTLVPARPFDDDVDGFYGTWFDITGMKSLELRQRNSEQRYRLLLDHLSSGHALHTIEVDEAGTPVNYRFLAMNTAFGAMLGIDAAAAVGARVTDVFPAIASDPADWIGRFGRVALTGEPARFEQAGASGRWWDIVAYRPVQGQFAVIAQDISERKRLEAEVAELRARLAAR